MDLASKLMCFFPLGNSNNNLSQTIVFLFNSLMCRTVSVYAILIYCFYLPKSKNQVAYQKKNLLLI